MSRVSIVVPFYEVEEYIGECLHSLINQTYENIEILCIDDQSPDESLEIVQEYASRDKRIKVIRHEENKGPGGARNTGIRQADGEYICFVDSDDYVSNRFVEVLVNTAKKEQADIVACSFSIFSDGSEKQRAVKLEKAVLELHQDKGNLFEIVQKIRLASWLKIYRRSMLVEHAIYQPEHRYYEGVVFWMACVYYSRKIVTTPEILYFYRQRPESIMTTFSYRHIDDRIAFMNQIDEFLRNAVLNQEAMDRRNIMQNAYAFQLDHAKYGRVLIKDTAADVQEAYDQYYYESLADFSRTSGWDRLVHDCYDA